MYKEAIIERFIRPLNRVANPFVGVELELPIINMKRGPVNYDVVQDAAAAFVKTFRFQNIKKDDNGRIWFAEDPSTGDTLSFDCSFNTLEWSFGREFDIHKLEERFLQYYTFTQDFLQKQDHMMTGMGINPNYLVNSKEPVANGRYRMLYQYLSEAQEKTDTFPLHRYPYFGMFCAASQVQMDVDQTQILDVIEVFNLLEPVKALLFANSVWPENPDIMINRDWLWEYSRHGRNARNVGLWNEPVRTIDELVEYLSGLSMFCTEREGKYLFFNPIPWKEYIESEELTGSYVESYFRTDKIRTMRFRPQKSDITYLRSYKYVDLTFRGTVEFRSTCTQPVSDTFSVAAFHAGLMQRLPQLKQLLTEGCPLFRQGMSPKVLRTLLSRRSLPASLNRQYIRDLLVKVLDLAREGLRIRGYKEMQYLDPLYLRAEQLSNPARAMITGLEKGQKPEYFIREYGTLEKKISHSVRQEFYRSSGIGLEEENLRIRPDGFLADTPHPIHNDPLIDRDFSEVQVEMVTNVKTSPEKLYESVLQKREKVVEILDRLETGKELLWPFSVPPYLRDEEEIRVAEYTDDLSWKSRYRDYLAEKYGKRKMLLSGIHFNFSYPEYYLRKRFEESAADEYASFVNQRYLELAEKSAAYSWLVVALTAASPVHDGSFWDAGACGKKGVDGFSSLRTSEHGYWNPFVPVLDYSDIESYVDSVYRYVQEGKLKAERELYYPIRVKPSGAFSTEGFRNGISHIEYRMLDLNPLDKAGIDVRDISFLLLLILWMEYQPPLHADEYTQKSFVTNMIAASRMPLEDIMLDDLDGRRTPLIEMGLRVLDSMESQLGKHPAIIFQKEKLLHPEKRYAEILKRRYDTDFVKRAVADTEKLTQEMLADLRRQSDGGMNI